jgi:hypothetical protein
MPPLRPGSLLLALLVALAWSRPVAAEESVTCSWEDVELSERRVLLSDTPVEIRRPFLDVRLLSGVFVRLEACGRTVGLAWQGTGEVELRDPGVERAHVVHNLYANLPGTLDLEELLLIASDGALEQILAEATAVEDVLPQVPGEAPWLDGAIPGELRSMVRTRLAPFDPDDERGMRLPGDLLAAPSHDLGGIFVEMKLPDIAWARPGETLLPPPRWLAYVHSEEGGFAPWEPGLLFERSVLARNQQLLAALPSKEARPDGSTPFAYGARPRRFDLLDADIVVRVGRPRTWDRDITDVEITATLRLRADEGAGAVVPLWLAEGRRRTLGEQWGALEIRRVRVDGIVASYDRVGDRLYVRLAGPAAPEQEIEIDVEYGGGLLEPTGQTAITPLSGWRWYPRPNPSDRHRFRVTAVVPKFWDVAATGRRVEELVSGPMRMITSRTLGEVEAGSLFVLDIRTRAASPPAPGLPVVRVLRHPDTRGGEAKIHEEVYEHLAVLSELLGPFPFAELEIVQTWDLSPRDSVPGVIVLRSLDSPPRQVLSSRVGTNTLLQALARQYLSADRGARSHHDAWLVEGLAVWAECWALAATDRPSRCQSMLKGKRDVWIRSLEGQGESWLVGPVWAGRFSGFAGPNSQLRGPLVLHRLRLLLGEEQTWELFRRFAQAYPGQRISTESFVLHAEGVAGYDLRRFFYGWVLATPQEPTARVTWSASPAADGTWSLRLDGWIDDGRDGDPLPMMAPILVAMRIDGETLVQRVVLTEVERGGLITGLPGEPKGLKLGPGKTFPGRTKLQKGSDD